MKTEGSEATWTELTGWMIRNHPWTLVKIIWRVIRRPFFEVVSFLLAVDVTGDLDPHWQVSPVTYITAFFFIWMGARFLFIYEMGRVKKGEV